MSIQIILLLKLTYYALPNRQSLSIVLHILILHDTSNGSGTEGSPNSPGEIFQAKRFPGMFPGTRDSMKLITF